jgi:glycosyltransferase involved in cell wall biosynthesis
VTRLDLAILLFDLAPSGVVRNAMRIADAAHKAGFETAIWVVQNQGRMGDELPRDVMVESLGLTVGDNYSRWQRKRASLSAADLLAALIRKRRPRILLSAGNHLHPLAVEAQHKAAVPGTRLIGRVSNELPRFSWSPLLFVPSVVKRVLARRRLRAMHRLVAVSEQLRRSLVKELWIAPGKIRVIPNGIDFCEVQRLAARPVEHPWFAQGVPVIVGVGRLMPQKDFALLLRAFAKARTHMPMRLMLLGAGPQYQSLRRLARKLGILGDVEFAGYVANPLAYLSKSSLFVLPSRWEGLSNALLEALAVGCPVVATRCPGSVEVLADGRWGELVPIGDEDGMSEAIVQVLTDPPPQKRQRERAAHYDLRKSMERYLDLFREETGMVAQATDRTPRVALDVQSRNSSSNIGWANTHP